MGKLKLIKMKISLLIVVIGLFAMVSCSKYSGNAAAGSNSKDLAGEIDSVSYSIGVDLANMVVQSKIKEVNAAALFDGFLAVINNDTAKLKIKVENTRPLITAYLQKAQKIEGEKMKKAGEDFLAENKKKEGVKVTASGLQYVVVKEGNGPIPADTSTVRVNYVGKLINDTVFDSSVKRGQPLEIQVNRLVPGWQEALKMMPVGSKWNLFIPQELAYGANGAGGLIEPYSTIIFEMELLEIVPPKAPENPANMGNKVQTGPKQGTK